MVLIAMPRRLREEEAVEGEEEEGEEDAEGPEVVVVPAPEVLLAPAEPSPPSPPQPAAKKTRPASRASEATARLISFWSSAWRFRYGRIDPLKVFTFSSPSEGRTTSASDSASEPGA